MSTIVQNKIKTFRSNISGLCNTAAAYTFLFLMVFFTVMRSVGLHELFALRDFNLVFLSAGILLALSSYYNKVNKNKMEYATGLKIGLRVTLTAVIPFALFMYFYLVTDESFMHLLKANLNSGELSCILGEFITPGIAAGIIGAEGLLSGTIITFLAMQYFKNRRS